MMRGWSGIRFLGVCRLCEGAAHEVVKVIYGKKFSRGETAYGTCRNGSIYRRCMA